MTRKFVAAIAAARAHGWSPLPSARAVAVYERLRELGLMWDSDAGVWVRLADEPANEPSALVRVRVWADGEIINEVADDVVGAMARRGWRLVERSMPYACRPPKQLEARVYLTLEPPARVKGGTAEDEQ